MPLRAAKPDDFDAVMRLYRQLQPDDPILEDGQDQAVFDQILATENLSLLVFEQDDEVVGTIYLNVIPNISRGASPYAIIENVVIDETLRGTGLGKAMMFETLERAWARGCYKAMLQTGSKRESTHAYYRSTGFNSTEKTGYLARPPSSPKRV